MYEYHIIITTYNRPESCEKLIRQIQKQLKGTPYSIHVFDDFSRIKPKIPKDRRIKYFRFSYNHGKQNYWKVVNFAFKQIPQSQYYFMLPDDIELKDNFFERAISKWKSIKDKDKVSLELMLNKERVGKKNWTDFLPQKVKCGNYLLWNTQWTDLCFVAERKFFDLVGTICVNPKRWKRNNLLSSGVGENISKRLHFQNYNMYAVTISLCLHDDLPSQMNPQERMVNKMESVGENVSVCIASIPSRKKLLIKAIKSLLPQCDKMFLYLNNYKKKDAKEIKNISGKIEYVIGDNSKGDAGKFFWAKGLKGYIFTCDDDIVYAKDYCSNAIEGIERYKRIAIITYHGKTFTFPIVKFYKGHTSFFHCLEDVNEDSFIHVGGTGVMAWHSDTITPKMKYFPSPNMADIHMAILAQKEKKPIVVLKHKKGWLKDLSPKETIYNTHVGKDGKQVRRMRSIKWKTHKLITTYKLISE
jgi:glycosyltransferase involved in cell wall biosynthesis